VSFPFSPLPNPYFKKSGLEIVLIDEFVVDYEKHPHRKPKPNSIPDPPRLGADGMGNVGAKANGLEEAPVSVKECVDGMIDKIDGATREGTSGRFVSFEGGIVNW
jgi:hypothetical protein